MKNELIENSKHRVYIEPDQKLMPGITHIGRLDFSSATQSLKPHTHNGAIEFCYLERGIAVFTCGKQKWTLKGGDCFLSYPDEVHGTGTHPLDRMKLFWIGYKLEVLIPWLNEGCEETAMEELKNAVGPSLPRTFTGTKRISSAINGAIDAYLGKAALRSINIKFSLLNLFLYLAEKKRNPRIISYEILNVIDYINNNLDKEIPLTFCADMAGVSLSRFKTRFKTETGLPPAEFILRKRINKAEALMKNGQSVLETSIDCGFSSSQYFSTVFKRYRNISPTGWLKQKTLS